MIRASVQNIAIITITKRRRGLINSLVGFWISFTFMCFIDSLFISYQLYKIQVLYIASSIDLFIINLCNQDQLKFIDN